MLSPMTEGVLPCLVSLSHYGDAGRGWAVYRVERTKGSSKLPASVKPRFRSLLI
jgi:hypothetical protein